MADVSRSTRRAFSACMRPSRPDASRMACPRCDSNRPPKPGRQDAPLTEDGEEGAGSACGLHQDVVEARAALHERLQRLHKVVLHAAAQAAVGQLHPLLQRQRAACLRRARASRPRRRQHGRASLAARQGLRGRKRPRCPGASRARAASTSASLLARAARPRRACAGLSSRTPASLIERRSGPAVGHATECAETQTQRGRAGGTTGPPSLQNRHASTAGVEYMERASGRRK